MLNNFYFLLRELNDMVQAHQKQIVAWEEDRQRVSKLLCQSGYCSFHVTSTHFYLLYFSMEVEKIVLKLFAFDYM